LLRRNVAFRREFRIGSSFTRFVSGFATAGVPPKADVPGVDDEGRVRANCRSFGSLQSAVTAGQVHPRPAPNTGNASPGVSRAGVL